MAYTRRSTSSVVTGTGTSIATSSAGASVGDLLVLAVSCNTAPASITTPTGWTLIGSHANGFASFRLGVYWRIADGSAADAPSVTLASSVNYAAVIAAYANPDPTTPFDTSAATSQDSLDATFEIGSVTAANNESLGLIIIASGNTALPASALPAGYTSLVEGEATAAVQIADNLNVSAGTHTPGNVTAAGSNRYAARLVIFKAGASLAAPVISSDGGGATATVTANEGQTAVTTVVATGNPTPTYSITGGDDADQFAINGTTGALTFNSAADYDGPTDADGDSVYLVTVTATNSQGSDSQDLTVIVNPMRSADTSTLPAPLNDALCYLKPVAYLSGNSQLPNLGTSDNPYILGTDYQSDAHDPAFSSTGGNHLVYLGASGNEGWIRTRLTASQMAGDFSVALKFKMTTGSVIQDLFNEMWDGVDEYGDDSAGDTKTKFLHIQADNTLEGRVWDSVTNSQVAIVGGTTLSVGTVYDVALTWDNTAKTLRLYLDGVEDATAVVASNARRARATDGYLWLPYRTLLLPFHGLIYRKVYWNRLASGSEIVALRSNASWISDAAGGAASLAVFAANYRRRRAA